MDKKNKHYFMMTINWRKKHMDNQYRRKTYVIHFLTSKVSLHTSVIKLCYPWTFLSTVQKTERKKERKKEAYE